MTKSLFFLKAQLHSLVVSSLLLFLLVVLTSSGIIRKESVLLSSSDSLQIRADEYIVGTGLPYILLLHEQGSSRGEFQSIAKKLCKMDYNCLAVDLRNGGTDHAISNETAKRCREERLPTGIQHVEADLLAAINYAMERSQQPVILFGSGANASLGLKVAVENQDVRAVAAFSPGEYFLPQISIKDTIGGMRKPVFATSSLSEIPYVKELVSEMDKEYLTVFEPALGEGMRGVESLRTRNDNHSEYWLALLLFFKELL